MAVMDFREGGYVFSRHKVRREFAYDQGGWDQDGAQDATQRFAADDPQGGAGLTARVARLTHYLGALASVALMVGLLAWGWQLVTRDVSGVPVIRAVVGDARTTPSEPGGELTSYTGYAVNNVAEGGEAQPVQQVAIAPSASVLTDDDVAMGALGASAHEPQTVPEVPLSFDGEPITPMSDSEARALAAATAAAEAERLAAANLALEQATIIDAPASEGPVTAVVTDETGAPTDAITAALREAQTGAVAASPRPAPRPRTMRVASASTTATDARPVAAAAPASAEAPAAPATRSASGPLVQLGAFDSDAIAANEWSRLAGKHGVFGGKQQVIQQHNSNGRTFWRLRVAGFDSIADARQFCAALKSGGTDCLALSQ